MEQTGPQAPWGHAAQPSGAWPAWPHEMGRPTPYTLFFRHLLYLLQVIESTYHMDEILHAWHVQVLHDHPEIARDPNMERFGRASEAALHAKVALAGLIKRVLLGDMAHEALQLLADQMRAWHTEQTRATVAFRELAAKPEAARAPAMQALRHLMGVGSRTARTIAHTGGQILGVELAPPGTEPAARAAAPTTPPCSGTGTGTAAVDPPA